MKTIALVLPLCLAAAMSAPARADEHPQEHPAAAGHEHPKEHPTGAKKKGEHPVGSKHWNKRMRKEFNRAIEDHVRDTSEDGAFRVQDEKLGKEWALKLKGVHKKRIVHLGGESFFACADFVTAGKGKKDKLDLDFYATKGPKGWTIDRTLIHKVNGKARYTYNDKNERVPVADR